MNKIEKLQHLIKVIENIPPAQFNMQNWTRPDRGCGTIHCAAGWAGEDLEFKKLGFRLDSYGAPKLIKTLPDYDVKILEDAGAVIEFFEISREVFDLIFMPSTYPRDGVMISAAMVIERINEEIAREQETKA